MENKKSKTIQMIGEIPIDFGKVSLNKKKEKIIYILKKNNNTGYNPFNLSRNWIFALFF